MHRTSKAKGVLTMKYALGITLGVLLGVGGAVAFFFASPETRELLVGLPWWATVAAALMIGALLGASFGLWHRRR
jgi:ABC-type xylose transport system permease subunit